LTLHLEELWHVRIGEHRQTIRRKFEHRVEGTAEAGNRLMRQTVNQIDADRVKAGVARGLHHRSGHLERLNAVDGLLHDHVEILHAQAQPVKAKLTQMSNGVG
jgi:hypothetical protein